MRATPHGVAAGVWAALQVPRWLDGPRLRELMEPPPVRPDGADAPRGAVGAAVRTVGLLGRIPGLPWRPTCLYRAVAECLVLRAAGVPAQLRIGVRNENPPHGAIAAHAWVVRTPADGGAEAPGENELLHALLAGR